MTLKLDNDPEEIANAYFAPPPIAVSASLEDELVVMFKEMVEKMLDSVLGSPMQGSLMTIIQHYIADIAAQTRFPLQNIDISVDAFGRANILVQGNPPQGGDGLSGSQAVMWESNKKER